MDVFNLLPSIDAEMAKHSPAGREMADGLLDPA